MLGGIAESVIIPGHIALTEAARELDGAAQAFIQAPSADGLEALREEWLATEIAWKHVELYDFPGLLLVHNAIESRPARVVFIEEAIAGADPTAVGEIDVAFIESLGSTSKGLSAIEYLIFSPDGDRTEIPESFSDPARRAYLTALSGNLVMKTQELLRFWAPDRENYAQSFRENDSEGADINGSVSLLANNMIEMHEIVMRRRLGMPMGQTTDGIPRPEEVESYLSGHSLELMTANVASLQRTFDAGLDDYLDYLDRGRAENRLSAAIHAQFQNVLGSLADVDTPLQLAVSGDPETVGTVFEAMRTLLVLLKTDMSALLGITVTFSDSDGD